MTGCCRGLSAKDCIARPNGCFDSDPVLRDDNHFRYFADEPKAVIPPDAKMVLDFKTTTERVHERQKWLNDTIPCPHCAGLGRVMK